MGKSLLFFHFLFAAVVFADPPYFIDNVEGVYLADIVNREKILLVPGTLNSCKDTYTSPSYSSGECKIDNAEVQLTIGGKTIKVSMGQLQTTEYQYDPKQPSILTYTFSGSYSEKLTNGIVLDTPVTLYFDRKGATPNRMQGRFNLVNFALGGTFIADLTTPPTP